MSEDNPHARIALIILLVTCAIMVVVAIAAVWVYAFRQC